MKPLSQGALLVAKIEAYFMRYMFMPPEYALVAALWALNTYVFRAFDATPYLVITAPTKGSGKTAFAELITMIAKSAKIRTDVTPATMFRLLEAHGGQMTIAIDEAEKLRHENHPLRPFANSGYRRGQTIPRTIPGGKVIDFEVFCPKLFILIGDVWDTLRDRSIVLWLTQGEAREKYRRSDAERYAIAITSEIEAFWKGYAGSSIASVDPTWLSGRDEEIWTPLVSLAHALELPKDQVALLEQASTDLTARKASKAKRYESDPDAEMKAQDDRYARRLLVDLAGVFQAGEVKVLTSVALSRLKAIPTAPWRCYKDDGLSEISMAGLLARFAVKPEVLHFKRKEERERNDGKLISGRGYQAAAVRKALGGLLVARDGGQS